MPGWPKTVVFSSRLGPNFLWHMLAVARIGYDSNYADCYGSMVNATCLDVLHRHAPLLRFGGGNTGGMTGLFTFLPGWLHLETGPGFRHYFATVDQCLSEGSFRFLATEFPRVDWSDKAFRHLPSVTFQPDPESRAIFGDLSTAYMESFPAYEKTVWPEASRAMAPRVSELAAWFARRDYILAWEEVLGIEFAARSYEIVLCHSNLNGPDYNSLGYSGNLFYYNKPFEKTWQFVSHEIGTHLLFDVLAVVSRERSVDPPKLHGPFEVLAMFYNRRVLVLDRLAYDLASCGDAELLPFYEQEHVTAHGPEELLHRAARYLEGDA